MCQIRGEQNPGFVRGKWGLRTRHLEYEFDWIPSASQLTTDFVKISIVGGGNTSIAF